MNTAATNLKQTALILHAMTSEDRKFILDQLQQDVRPYLETLISDLDNLGFVPQFDFLESVISLTESRGRSTGDSEQVTSSEFQLQPNLHLLLRILNAEPPRVVAQILKIKKWAFEEKLLGMMSPIRKEMILQTKNGIGFASEQQTILLRVFDQRYDSLRQSIERERGFPTLKEAVHRIKHSVSSMHFVKKWT
jgi:hypothetical protein